MYSPDEIKKEFLSITGDGVSNILQLIKTNKRAILQLEQIMQNKRLSINSILPLNEKVVLVPYGNHARGALFTDQSKKITQQFTDAIDNVCKQINGFYYGRLDIQYNTWEELEKGQNFTIIEVNGSGSEPTHIYDPNHTIYYAWKEIIKTLEIFI